MGKQDDESYKVMEGVVRTELKIRHRTMKRGLFGSIADVFKNVGGCETAQEAQDEKEVQLHAALTDGTVLNTYIGENFVAFLNGIGIQCEPVDQMQLIRIVEYNCCCSCQPEQSAC